LSKNHVLIQLSVLIIAKNRCISEKRKAIILAVGAVQQANAPAGGAERRKATQAPTKHHKRNPTSLIIKITGRIPTSTVIYPREEMLTPLLMAQTCHVKVRDHAIEMIGMPKCSISRTAQGRRRQIMSFTWPGFKEHMILGRNLPKDIRPPTRTRTQEPVTRVHECKKTREVGEDTLPQSAKIGTECSGVSILRVKQAKTIVHSTLPQGQKREGLDEGRN
jgi:hypothetical protein